jgi:2-iminobutanoate/2-iminopropanoate deaminase
VRKTLDNPSAVPAPSGAYSHVARVELDSGTLLVVSGQVATGPDGELVGEGDMTAQSERVFDSLGEILAAHGATFADVINIRTYVTDMDLIREYALVRRRYLTGERPTSTTVEVSRLVVPGAMVEVEAMAALSA